MKMWVKIAITAGSLAAAGAGGYFGWKFWGKKWWAGRKAAKEPLEVEYFFDRKEADEMLKDELEKDPRSHPIVKDDAEKDISKHEFSRKMSDYLKDDEARENFEQYMAGLEIPDEEDEDEEAAEDDIHRGADEPYVISRGEFFNTRSYYDKVSVNYYDDDHVVADEKDEVLQNAERLLGDLQDTFSGEDAPGTVYIRNEALEIDYEVNLVRGNYHEEVLQLKKEE